MLSIFPERALDSSIHTSIFVGILVMWLATETLGWAFAGFVVPGYLAALAIVQPMAVVSTVLEAVLTYGLAWGAAKGSARLRIWSSAFGRERFLLFVLFSIPVRLVVEGLCGAELQRLAAYFGAGATWTDVPFHSVGLVLVPLLANAFWWPGLARGMSQVAMVSGATYLIVLQVLLRYTNLQLGHLELVFESLALEFGSVPKVHIILLTAAVVAARNNVKYGWDFNGILVPSLLAVIVTVPSKFFVTLLEVMVLAFSYRTLVRAPGISSLNLEGPRQLVTMYMLSFALKWMLSAAAEAFHVDFMISDVFGFGYLLTSLLAVKCVSKRNYIKTLLPVAYTSVVGFLVGALITVALTVGSMALLGGGSGIVSSAPSARSIPLERAVLGSYAAVRRAPPDSFRANPREPRAIVSVLSLLSGGSTKTLDLARRELERKGLRVQWATRADGRRCLAATAPRPSPAEPSGSPPLFFCGGEGPILLVPRPLSDPRSLIAAAYLAHRIDVAAVVVVGFDLGRDSPALRELDRHALAQAIALRRALGRRSVLLVQSSPQASSSLEPRSSSGQLPIAEIRKELPEVAIRFEGDHGPLQKIWHQLRSKDGLLAVSAQQLARRLRAQTKAERRDESGAALLERGFCSNRAWGEASADPGVREQRSKPPTLREALLFGELLVGELMRAVSRGKGALPPVPRYLASTLGVPLERVVDSYRRPLWLLDGGSTRGVWAFRPGAAGDWVYAASHAPSHRETAPAACTLFDRHDGPVLWISRSSCPGPVKLPRADSVLVGPTFAMAEAFAIREALRPRRDDRRWQKPRRLLFVSRLISEKLLDDGAVASIDHELINASEREGLLRGLGDIRRVWPFIVPYDGKKADMPLVGRTCFPLRYANALAPSHGVALWLAPRLLRECDGHTAKKERMKLYRELGVTLISRQRAHALRRVIARAERVEGEQIFELMRRHTLAGLRGPLEVLRARRGGALLVADHGLRLELFFLGEAMICRASSAPESPRQGCWRLERGRAGLR